MVQRITLTVRSVLTCLKRIAAFMAIAVLLLMSPGAAIRASAQSLNWEGQDGIFVTPLAYAVPSRDHSIGRPIFAYHYLNAGSVIGGFHQISVTAGAFNRIEFGYTRSVHQDGTTAGLSNLWGDGFNAFHGKINLVHERRSLFRPAVSAGFVARSQVRNVGGVIRRQNTSNADFYLVATKTITDMFALGVSYGF